MYASTNPITFSNVQVNDIGAHTANVSFDYAIEQSQVSKIRSVCFIIDVQKVTAVQATAPIRAFALGPYDVPCEGTDDEDMTAGDYERIYGLSRDQDVFIGGDKIGTADYYYWHRYYDGKDGPTAWNGETSGHRDLALIGLQPDSAYGNYNGNTQYPLHAINVNLKDHLDALYRSGNRSKVSLDMRQLALGARIEYKNGDIVPFGNNAVPIPDLITKSEPAGASQGNLHDSDAGKLTYDGGIATAGSVARMYVKNLQDEAKKKIDAGQPAFWYSYIYSDPVSLKSPDGAPYVVIKKDDHGKYYYDAMLPAGYSGDHRIGLQDENGVAQGWTTVTVSTRQATFSDVNDRTPHALDIHWLASQGVTTGFSDGTYRGMNSVIRQDMAAFLRREAKIRDIEDARTWVPSSNDWKRFKDVNRATPHAEDILWLAHAGISTGYDDGTFGGTIPVYRQDMAAFLKRLADKAGKADGVSMKTDFTDVNNRTPHRSEIEWLGGSGISTGYRNADGSWRFGGMVPVYRQDMAAFIHRLDGRLT